MKIQAVTALLFLAAGAAATWLAGVDLGHLAHLSESAAIAAGAVAVAGAAAVVSGGRLFARARGRGLALGAIWALGFLGVGLAAFDNRAAAALLELPSKLEPSLTRYCPPPSSREPPPPPPPKKVARAQGCALIIRAYELGYTKSLGSCAPEEVEATTAAAEEPEPPEICRDRRAGEPLVHYSWRVLDRALGEVAGAARSGAVGDAAGQTQTRLDFVGALAGSQWHAITSSPRSAHLLLTNLAPPRDRGWLEELGGDGCGGDPGAGGGRLGFDSASELVARAHAQLLFDPRFGDPVGNCREHPIHWSQAPDICARLRADPAGVLDDLGELDGLEAAVDRLRHQVELAELRRRLGESPRGPLPAATEIASVSCLIAGAGEPGLERGAVEIAGARVEVSEVRVGPLEARGAAQLQVYEHLGRLLSGVRYAGRLEGEAPLAAGQTLPPDLFDGPGFLLARLEPLREADPFAGHAAPIDRGAIAEVYPFAIHLARFVEVFRRAYRARRRRL